MMTLVTRSRLSGHSVLAGTRLSFAVLLSSESSRLLTVSLIGYKHELA